MSEGGKYERNRFNLHMERFFNGKRLNEVTGFDLERLKQNLKGKNLSEQSIKHVLVLFRCIFNKAVAWGLYDGPNPLKVLRCLYRRINAKDF